MQASRHWGESDSPSHGVERLQQLMGHSSIQTTLRYVHWIPSAREGEGALDLLARLEVSDA